MKKHLVAIFILFLLCHLAFGQTGVRFKSSDESLENAFTWAKAMALHYKSGSGDAVGPWYESALPPRDAFCMRDVSHQCIGAEILGMHLENKNMFTKFAQNISVSKDWCSYWEIDKYDRPSPADYRSDREFWYNLNANFDIMDASWRSYLWTGDNIYIKDSSFLYFYNKTAHEYINKWILQPDSLLIRPAYPNAPVPFNIDDDFDRCRGLPSYSEGIHNLKMGVDLVAALYRGLISYAAILALNGDRKGSLEYVQKAEEYRQLLDKEWWDKEASLYNTHYTNDNKFGKAEGETFLLWFDALKDSFRKKNTIEHLLSMDLNVENLSYLPLQYYKNGYSDKARKLILHLADPLTKRREYPEVSYGIIEAIVQGLMGVDVNAATHTITTMYRSDNVGRAQLTDLPVFKTTLTIKHFGYNKSTIINTSKYPFKWKAMFKGSYETGIIGSTKRIKLNKGKDEHGNDISYVEEIAAPGKEINIEVK